MGMFYKWHAVQLQGINSFLNFFFNSGNVFESFIFFGIYYTTVYYTPEV